MTLGNIKAEVVGITLKVTADGVGNFEQDQKRQIFVEYELRMLGVNPEYISVGGKILTSQPSVT